MHRPDASALSAPPVTESDRRPGVEAALLSLALAELALLLLVL
jgi:hypothetical protein